MHWASVLKKSKPNPRHSECRNSTVASYTLCATFPGITCCTGFILRMHTFYSHGISRDICWKDIYFRDPSLQNTCKISSNSSLCGYTNTRNIERNTCTYTVAKILVKFFCE